MRCLLDKVTARYVMQGLLKLAEERALTPEEIFSLDFFTRASSFELQLFIVPPTSQVLQKIAQLPRYTPLIESFLRQVDIVVPARYFRRWARRLRDCHFSREDAAVLALATFGTNATGTFLGMHTVATFDQPMITNWTVQRESIQQRLKTMLVTLPQPYCAASLPDVLRPEQIL